MNKAKLLLLLVPVVLSACIKDKFELDKLNTDVVWNPNMAAPAIHSTLNLRDILMDYDYNELFEEDQTGFMYLMYHRRVFSMPASDIIAIPAQIIVENFSGSDFMTQGFPIPNPNVTITRSYSHSITMGNSELIDSLTLKEGNFSISVASNFQHTGTVTVTFPTVTLNGIPYTKIVNINTSTGTFNFGNTYADLAGYKIDLSNPAANQLPVNIAVTLTNSGNAVVPGNNVYVGVQFSDLKYSIMWGDFGQQPVTVNIDTVHVELFNHALDGFAYFMDPKFRLTMTNSFGVPLGVAFNDFQIWSASDMAFLNYTFPATYNPFYIAAPTIPGEEAESEIVLDTLNFPVIRDIVFKNPRYVYLAVGAITNPLGSSSLNFITDTSRFSVDLELELPLWGRASWWVVQDTIEFKFSDYYKIDTVDFDDVDYVMLKLNMENGMPTEAGVQIYFTDTLYNILDSAMTQSNMEVLLSGVLDANGKVIAPTRKITEIMIPKSRIMNLVNAGFILIRGYIHTTAAGSQNVRFYSHYNIDVKVGVRVQATVHTEDL